MLGIDEAGRGCWAGPLVVAAVRKNALLPNGITDSKRLNAIKRAYLYEIINKTTQVGIGWAWPTEIDQYGLTQAHTMAAHRALNLMRTDTSEHILLDGKYNYVPADYGNVQTLVRADFKDKTVGAASIIAKHARDSFMHYIAKTYPQYSFDKHVGYGTKAHVLALRKYGPVVDLHRYSYKPVKALVG